MMITEAQLVESIETLDGGTLQRWIDRGWVMTNSDDDRLTFDTADVARVRLICQLHYDLRIEEDSMSIVLSLMDQLYATRRSLSTLIAAIEALPPGLRAQIEAEAKRQRHAT